MDVGPEVETEMMIEIELGGEVKRARGARGVRRGIEMSAMGMAQG